MISRIGRGLILAGMITLIGFGSGCNERPSNGAATTATPTQPIATEPGNTPTALTVTTTPTLGLANPAAVHCQEQGGQWSIRNAANGSQFGVCLFADGSVCEEWAFFRGECRPGDSYTTTPPVTSADNTDPRLAALFATVWQTLPTGAFEELVAQPITGSDGALFWLVSSSGLRSFEPATDAPHFIAIYVDDANGWRELDRRELTSDQREFNLAPDYIDAIERVQITPDRIWLQVAGGMGAHSGSYHLFSFDGQRLRLEVEGFADSPGIGFIDDVNGDGINDVVLNLSERYIFCYACGVYYPYYRVYTWDGNGMLRLDIADLDPAYQNAPFAELNQRAVTLAKADLWAEALETINQAVALAGDADPPTQAGTLRWNQTLIRVMHDAHRRAIEESAYPLVNYVFYGDAASAVNLMRTVDPARLFSLKNPLIVGTVAEGWETSLGDYLITASDRILAVHPDRAEVWFIRAWGLFLRDPGDPEIDAALAQAAQLQPADPLFAFFATPRQR